MLPKVQCCYSHSEGVQFSSNSGRRWLVLVTEIDVKSAQVKLKFYIGSKELQLCWQILFKHTKIVFKKKVGSNTVRLLCCPTWSLLQSKDQIVQEAHCDLTRDWYLISYVEKKTRVLRLNTQPLTCCQAAPSLFLIWNKMVTYFKPCGRASLCQRICTPSLLIYRCIKGEHVIHVHWEQWSVCTAMFLLSLPEDQELTVGDSWKETVKTRGS